MEGKKSFVLYSDNIHMISAMPNEDAGKLFKMIFEYVNDKNPDEKRDGPLVEAIFAHVKQRFKEDLIKWKATKEKRSTSGKKGAEAKHGKTWQMPEVATQNEKTVANLAVNVNVYTTYIEDVCSFFKVNEINNVQNFKLVTYFIEWLGVNKKLEYFQKQFPAYKKMTTEQNWKHNVKNFIGSPKLNYEDGAWCAESYADKVIDKPKTTREIILGL